MARDAVLWLAVLLIAGLAGLTVNAVLQDGVSVLAIISFAILFVLGVGVLGALGNPPDDRS